MFTGLEVGTEATRGLLVTRYAVADCFAILVPFDRAIEELQAVIELARALGGRARRILGQLRAASAYRYAGRGEDAVALLGRDRTAARPETSGCAPTSSTPQPGLLVRSACMPRQIRLGQDQVQSSRRSRTGSSSAQEQQSLLPYYVIGLPEEAARRRRIMQ